MNQQNHPFHLVSLSPWPFFTSLAIMMMTINMTMMMNNLKNSITPSIMMLIICMFQWWRDITWEALNQGMHTKMVMSGLRMGMILFIISEVLFFMSMFWLLFHSSISPSILFGMKWPPSNIMTFNPMDIPLLNTILLLSSGVFITASHYSLMNNKMKAIKLLAYTIILGLMFTLMQMYEYSSSSFTMADSIYGSTFFMITGFHGMHVMIGSVFLLTTLIRMKMMQMNKKVHLGFEFAAWYWHFVDVIWLCVYMWLYF